MTSRQRYTRVPQEDNGAVGASAARGGGSGVAGAKSSRKQLAESISDKMHALIWVGGALFVAYYTDFLRLVWADQRLNRIALDISLMCDGVFLAIGFYLTIWLRYIKGNKLEWRVIAPRAIPAATIFAVLATITFMIAFWPVWGLLTLPITALFLMGILFSAHFIPAC